MNEISSFDESCDTPLLLKNLKLKVRLSPFKKTVLFASLKAI